MHEHYQDQRVDAVAAARRGGFCFAAPLALLMQRPLIPLPQPGKLALSYAALQDDLEYAAPNCSSTRMAWPRAHVLLIDDLLATGGPCRPPAASLKRRRHVVAARLVEIAVPQGREKLKRMRCLV